MSGTDGDAATQAESECDIFTHCMSSTGTQFMNSDNFPEFLNAPEEDAKAREFLYRQEVLFCLCSERITTIYH